MKRAAAAAALLATSLALAGTAGAQPPSFGDLALHETNLDLQARVNALDERLSKSGVQRLLAQANRTAVHNGPCREDAFPDIPAGSQWYCFDRADGADGGGEPEWIPQGVTTVADAQADGLWGTREALLVSWYDDTHPPRKGVRVSFLEPSTKRYRHLLLVYPYIRDDNGEPTYEIVGRPKGGIHAGGILWYGNYLYVVDTRRGSRVFDMRYIFGLEASPNGNTSDKRHIGWGELTLRPDIYRGFGYRYVMPACTRRTSTAWRATRSRARSPTTTPGTSAAAPAETSSATGAPAS